MNHRAILESICDECGPSIKCEPHQITANGQRYEFATDDFQLLAFPVEQSDLPEIPADIPKAEIVKQRIAGWLTAPATHTTSAAGFANFLNLAECAKCPCCKGTGKRGTQTEYVFTGNAAYDEYVVVDQFADPRYVKINGFPFNANLIAYMLVLLDLNHLAGEDLPVRIETENLNSDDKGDGAALILHGVKWTIAIMGMSIKRTANADFDSEWELEAI